MAASVDEEHRDGWKLCDYWSKQDLVQLQHPSLQPSPESGTADTGISALITGHPQWSLVR